MNFNHFVYGEEKYVPVQALVRDLNKVKEKIKAPDLSQQKKTIISTKSRNNRFFEKEELKKSLSSNTKTSIKEIEELC